MVDPTGREGYQLNPQEWRLALRHPRQFWHYQQDARFSLKRAEDFAAEGYYGWKSLWNNGIGDAFRHALWNAVLCQDIGIGPTETWTNAHENGDTGQPAREKQMDLHNNFVGRSFYVRYSSQNMRNWSLEMKLIREPYWKTKLWWFGHGV